MQATPKEVIVYETSDGISPFDEWLTSLRDKKAVDKITLRIRRIEQGNLGDYKSVGQIGNTIVVLLCGGDKTTQDNDIVKAQQYWEDYRS